MELEPYNIHDPFRVSLNAGDYDIQSEAAELADIFAEEYRERYDLDEMPVFDFSLSVHGALPLRPLLISTYGEWQENGTGVQQAIMFYWVQDASGHYLVPETDIVFDEYGQPDFDNYHPVSAKTQQLLNELNELTIRAQTQLN